MHAAVATNNSCARHTHFLLPLPIFFIRCFVSCTKTIYIFIPWNKHKPGFGEMSSSNSSERCTHTGPMRNVWVCVSVRRILVGFRELLATVLFSEKYFSFFTVDFKVLFFSVVVVGHNSHTFIEIHRYLRALNIWHTASPHLFTRHTRRPIDVNTGICVKIETLFFSILFQFGCCRCCLPIFLRFRCSIGV